MTQTNISKIEACANEFDMFVKIAFIRKLPNGQWAVKSEKGKILGKYKKKEDAVKRLKQIEWFKHHKKKASKDESYSSIMRDLNKTHDDESVKKFQREFKRLFDEAVLAGDEHPEKCLEEAMKCIASEDISIAKFASAIDLGDPAAAGKYLADLIKFLLRRISSERRQKSIENLKKKIYYLNEYNMAAKHAPPSSALGQSITLLKHILLEHNPKYIREVLNNIVRNM